MKTDKVACNYAIIRFRPYPETEEFVSVGVVIGCPEKHVFDFRIEMQRQDRVTGFFPELNSRVFTQGREDFRQELERVREYLNRPTDARPSASAVQEFNRAFMEVVRQRESVFRFSGIGTRLADDPKEALDYLFGYYVERLFARVGCRPACSP